MHLHRLIRFIDALGIEKAILFDSYLQTAERACLYETEEASKAHFDWIFGSITDFIKGRVVINGRRE